MEPGEDITGHGAGDGEAVGERATARATVGQSRVNW